MLHEPAASSGKDPAAGYKSRLGAWMFLLYALVYAGFVAINLGAPARMGEPFFWGLNLAVVYGFFLIFFALVLAVIYNFFCIARERKLASGNQPAKGA